MSQSSEKPDAKASVGDERWDRRECYNPPMFLSSLLLVTSIALAQSADASDRLRRVAQEALDAARLRLWDNAIAKYREELSIEPHNLSAQMGLAEAYREVHNYQEAKRVLERATAEHPKSEEPLATLGDLDIELQTYSAAVEHLRRAVALNPADEWAQIRLAVAYRSKGDSSAALEELNKVLVHNRQSALAYYERAQIYSDRNENDAAQRDAEKAALGSNPGLLLLAKILLRPRSGDTSADAAKRCEEAVLALEPLWLQDTNDSEALFLISRANQCAGHDADAQKALAEFEVASKNDRATKENQTAAKHLVQQANEAAMKNDFQGALDLLQQALEKDSTYGAAYSQLAKLYYSAGRIDEASEAIGKALERDPYQPDFLYVEGKILERQRKLDEALAAFERATLVNPRESDAFFEMGAIYQQRNDRAHAMEAYRKAVALSPDDPDYRKALAALK